MGLSVIAQVDLDVSKGHSSFIFWVRQSKKNVHVMLLVLLGALTTILRNIREILADTVLHIRIVDSLQILLGEPQISNPQTPPTCSEHATTGTDLEPDESMSEHDILHLCGPFYYCTPINHDGEAGIGYEPQVLGFETRWRDLFSSPKRPNSLWCPPTLVLNWHWVSFPRVKRQRPKVHHSHLQPRFRMTGAVPQHPLLITS